MARIRIEIVPVEMREGRSEIGALWSTDNEEGELDVKRGMENGVPDAWELDLDAGERLTLGFYERDCPEWLRVAMGIFFRLTKYAPDEILEHETYGAILEAGSKGWDQFLDGPGRPDDLGGFRKVTIPEVGRMIDFGASRADGQRVNLAIENLGD